MREDIKQYVAAIVHGCASTGTWNADTVRRGVEVGMSLRRGSLKPEIGTIEDLIGEVVLAERQVEDESAADDEEEKEVEDGAAQPKKGKRTRTVRLARDPDRPGEVEFRCPSNRSCPFEHSAEARAPPLCVRAALRARRIKWGDSLRAVFSRRPISRSRTGLSH